MRRAEWTSRTEGTRARVHVTGRGGPGGREQGRVDDGGETLNARSLDGNDERRTRGGRGKVEVGVVVWHEETDDGDTTDVEQEDTDVDTADTASARISGTIKRMWHSKRTLWECCGEGCGPHQQQ